MTLITLKLNTVKANIQLFATKIFDIKLSNFCQALFNKLNKITLNYIYIELIYTSSTRYWANIIDFRAP